MKVRCINGSRFLIKDKIYEVMSVKGDMYVLYQTGPLSQEQYEWDSTWFHKVNFETIEDKRDRRLNELGI